MSQLRLERELIAELHRSAHVYQETHPKNSPPSGFNRILSERRVNHESFANPDTVDAEARRAIIEVISELAMERKDHKKLRGFKHLVSVGHWELTCEGLAFRYPALFADHVVTAAEKKLRAKGVNLPGQEIDYVLGFAYDIADWSWPHRSAHTRDCLCGKTVTMTWRRNSKRSYVEGTRIWLRDVSGDQKKSKGIIAKARFLGFNGSDAKEPLRVEFEHIADEPLISQHELESETFYASRRAPEDHEYHQDFNCWRLTGHQYIPLALSEELEVEWDRRYRDWADRQLDELERSGVSEGRLVQVLQSRRERSIKVRNEFLEDHDYVCEGCGVRLEDVYGEWARELIHVHHLDPLLNGGRITNVKTDLAALCPNCHAVVHHRVENHAIPRTVEAVREQVERRRK
jgi:predicted HNH restriction endonuclease